MPSSRAARCGAPAPRTSPGGSTGPHRRSPTGPTPWPAGSSRRTRAAREREGAGAAPWALERDLARAVDDLLGGLTDPPDPAVLVEERVRRVRRRGLVLGLVAAAAAVGGVAAAVALRDAPASPAAVALPATTDRAWASTSRWPTRGPLAADPLLRAFPGRRAAWGDHVLWAGDLGSRRLVVLWSDDEAHSGRRPASGSSPDPGVPTSSPSTRSTLMPMAMPATDCVAVVVADGPDATTADRSLLLVLGRPVVERASYSPVLRPTVSGGLERSWTEVVLDQGVGALVLPHPVPLALRVRVDGHDGRPVTPSRGLAGLGEGPPRDVVETFVATPDGDPPHPAPHDRHDGRRGGGWAVRRPGRGREGGRADGHAADDDAGRRGPAVRLLRRGHGRFVAGRPGDGRPRGRGRRTVRRAGRRRGPGRLAVPRGARGSRDGPARSPPTRTTGLPRRVVETGGRTTTVVQVEGGDAVGEYRVVLTDRRGRTVFDGVPAQGRTLWDE